MNTDPSPSADDLVLPDRLDRRSRPASWRDVLKVHPAADMFPMMSREELIELGEDIVRSGMRVPIMLHTDLFNDKAKDLSDWCLLDGRNRLDAIEAVGLTVTVAMSKCGRNNHLLEPVIIMHGDRLRPLYDDDLIPVEWTRLETGADPWAYVISANLHRRHLTNEQKREIAEKLLKANPEKSNRAIAGTVKLDDKTLASIRQELEERSEIPHVETRTDSKGRRQPAKKKTKERSISIPAKYRQQVHDGIDIFSDLSGQVKAEVVAKLLRNENDRLVTEKGEIALTWLTRFMEAWVGRS